jgi:xanthine dehydrogenase YagS FAD-binding subunit
MRAFSYHRAATPAAAIAAAGSTTAYVAGGTTLIDLVKLDVLRPARLIDVNGAGSAAITARADGGLRVGALVRNSDLARHPLVREKYPVLAEAILSGASPQLRNMATTGGNLMQRTRCTYYRDGISPCNKREPGSGCAAWEGIHRSHAVLGGSEACIATHPSDMCVALAALAATISLQGRAGRRTLPFDAFHLLPGATPEKEHALLPGELITAVTLPAPAKGERSWYLKLRDRESYEFALASAAVVLRLQGRRIASCRIALGGVGTKPWRAHEAEAVLTGAVPAEALFRHAAEAALQSARPRPGNAFKVELARRVLVRVLALLVEGQPSVRQI